MNPDRVLLIAHGHPSQSKGGAEMAAYDMFHELRRRGIDAMLLARSGLPAHGGSAFSSCGSDRELLFHTGMSDFFNFRSAHLRHVTHDFAALLARYRPTVVHFHHYVHLGLELIREVHRTCPDARIVVTLHEYLAICNQNGQMVKKQDHALCYAASPTDCARCFPDRSPADFFLRERYIKSTFDLVDHFVSPSVFLKARYVDWGLAADRITVIENGQPRGEPALPEGAPLESGKVRLGFFGQLNPYKGIDLLLEALHLLPREIRAKLRLNVHGTNLQIQERAFQERCRKLARGLESVVHLHGSYDARELTALMNAIDWLVIPSVWWENSPIVIQEAFRHRRPVIGADIGGMAEKISHGHNGLLFRARDAEALAATLKACVSDPGLSRRLSANIKPPPTIDQTTDAHLRLYASAAAPVRSADELERAAAPELVADAVT